jgi:hypothetical protein
MMKSMLLLFYLGMITDKPLLCEELNPAKHSLVYKSKVISELDTVETKRIV